VKIIFLVLLLGKGNALLADWNNWFPEMRLLFLVCKFW